jgi:HAD superfamily hydrolase (TIGR01484 family)
MLPRPKLVFSDFDGTLTHHDELRPIFFQILDLLNTFEIPLVIVTGRSKSWAHFLLTHFPTLHHVMSEGGGVMTMRGEHDLIDQVLIEKRELEKLEKVVAEISKLFPQFPLTSDSFGRQTDRAIDLKVLAEDPKAATELKDWLKLQQINFSESNVHLNFWAGNISKARSMDWFIGEKIELSKEDVWFFGDSMNDESVFESFPHTIGVANIKAILNRLKFPPTVILEGAINEGPQGVFNFLSTELK